MRVEFSIDCVNTSHAWLNQEYSPNLRNGDKLKSNLTRAGDPSQPEWLNNAQQICDIFDCTLQEIQQITVEKIHFTAHSNMLVDLSFLMNDKARLHKCFLLSRTLNIAEEYRPSKLHELHKKYLVLPSANSTSETPEPMEESSQQPTPMETNRP